MSLEATLATWELTKDQVNAREKFLLLSLARRAGEEHTCWPSLKRMVEDTGFNRKTIVDVRQSLIDKKLLKYTGRMVGRSGQIPEMKLLFVDQWEQKRNSPRLKDNENEPVDNSSTKSGTSTKTGTGTSTKTGTGTSTENGTVNSKEEKVSRKKSFCAVAPEKPKAKSNLKKSNAEKHSFASAMDNKAQSAQQMQREAQHIEQHEAIKRAPMPENLRNFIKQMSKTRGGGYHDKTTDGRRVQKAAGQVGHALQRGTEAFVRPALE